MLRNPTVLSALGVLALLAALVAGLSGNLLLLAGLVVLACAAFWGLQTLWSYVVVGTFLLGLALAAARKEVRADPLVLLGGLALLAGLVFLFVGQRRALKEVARTQNVIRALEQGSAELADAKDTASVIRAGVQTLAQLQVAPNLAFVAYRRGTPHVLGARGVFTELLGKPILPGNGNSDSRSVQADHWVAERALGQIPREQRQFFLSIPVEGVSGQQLGLLLFARPQLGLGRGRRLGTKQGDFLPADLSVITAFARLLGSALGQWQSIRELRDANELTLRSLGSALEHRDDETGGHTARVVELSEKLARKLGWKEDAVKSLRWGAYLHDLGKLAIPDAILHKPGQLTTDERSAIQRHTTVGYDMLQDLHFLPAETLDLVRYHHERWDGAGYPSGLRGQDIPSTARVFSIVDVYDALTSARPYKSAWTRERALTEIKLQGGRQFDPQFVEAFVGLMTEKDDVRLVR
ncbi:HD-GYP domain-containing protein [Deinococcus altitudinis]|uniref:HD-GYP domain-containing protein n=1 Tax=Deinococcus altitudinis TaxID=468914 RepID=UPI0038917B88